MAEKQTIKRIENHTERFILLPPTPSFPQGVKLVPGLNTVTVKYLEELDERVLESEPVKRGGRLIPGRKRYPAQEMWAQLQAHVSLMNTNGQITYGPQVTIYDDIMADRQDGPPPPLALPSNNKELAKRILAATTERKALERWASQGRGELPELAKQRLRDLEGLHG